MKPHHQPTSWHAWIKRSPHFGIKRIIALSLFVIAIFSLLPFVTYKGSVTSVSYANTGCLATFNDVCNAYTSTYPADPLSSDDIKKALDATPSECRSEIETAITSFAASNPQGSFDDCVLYLLYNVPGV